MKYLVYKRSTKEKPTHYVGYIVAKDIIEAKKQLGLPKTHFIEAGFGILLKMAIKANEVPVDCFDDKYKIDLTKIK